MTSSTSSTTWSSSQEDQEVEYDVRKEDHSLLLIIMFGTHFCFFLVTYFWLYPTDEPPKKAKMHKMATDIKISHRTGEPIRPSARLYPSEIARLVHRKRCPERGYILNSEDQKTLTVVQDGEVNYLRNSADLMSDTTMRYGNLIVRRGVPVVEVEVDKKEIKEQYANLDEEAAVEDLLQLKREKAKKEPEKQKKKKRTKERMDALDQLTRGQSAEKLTLFSRILPDRHAQSRKVQKTVSSTMRNLDPTLEDDKTQQRVVKKPSTMRPHQRPSAMEINVKKKKSATLKDGKTIRKEPSLASTIEETTRNKPSESSREPPPTSSIAAPS